MKNKKQPIMKISQKEHELFMRELYQRLNFKRISEDEAHDLIFSEIFDKEDSKINELTNELTLRLKEELFDYDVENFYEQEEGNTPCDIITKYIIITFHERVDMYNEGYFHGYSRNGKFFSKEDLLPTHIEFLEDISSMIEGNDSTFETMQDILKVSDLMTIEAPDGTGTEICERYVKAVMDGGIL